jgi:hypothetical protein
MNEDRCDVNIQNPFVGGRFNPQEFDLKLIKTGS